ncbi:MAG: hypothetical protein WCR42_08975 [bacterium]
MKKYLSLSIIAIAIMLFSGCTDSPTDNKDTTTLEEKYQSAIVDAMIADSNEISHSLIPVVLWNSDLYWQRFEDTTYVLALILTKYPSSYPVDQTVATSWGDTWVSVVPELHDFFKNYQFSTDSALQLRLQQLLGLPATSGSQYLVEAWVKPENLFRPAPNYAISDTVADLYFPSGINPEYIIWFNNNIITSYYPEKGKTKYPWTRLGYTYDWGNPMHEEGLSEFVLRKNSQVIVKSVKTPREYIVSVN